MGSFRLPPCGTTKADGTADLVVTRLIPEETGGATASCRGIGMKTDGGLGTEACLLVRGAGETKGFGGEDIRGAEAGVGSVEGAEVWSAPGAWSGAERAESARLSLEPCR